MKNARTAPSLNGPGHCMCKARHDKARALPQHGTARHGRNTYLMEKDPAWPGSNTSQEWHGKARNGRATNGQTHGTERHGVLQGTERHGMKAGALGRIARPRPPALVPPPPFAWIGFETNGPWLLGNGKVLSAFWPLDNAPGPSLASPRGVQGRRFRTPRGPKAQKRGTLDNAPRRTWHRLGACVCVRVCVRVCVCVSVCLFWPAIACVLVRLLARLLARIPKTLKSRLRGRRTVQEPEFWSLLSPQMP